jgi:hypothetical protein
MGNLSGTEQGGLQENLIGLHLELVQIEIAVLFKGKSVGPGELKYITKMNSINDKHH